MNENKRALESYEEAKHKNANITDVKIADFFNISTRSLQNWKKDEKLKHRYFAFKDYLTQKESE